MRRLCPKRTTSSRIAKTSGDYTVIAGQCKFERGANTASVMWRGALGGHLEYGFSLDLRTSHLLDKGHGEVSSGDLSLSNCGRAEIDLYSFKRTSPGLAPLGLETNFF